MVKCRCCGKETLTELDAWEVCEYCGWEDDAIQADNEDLDGGANTLSLVEAREYVNQGKNVRGGSLPCYCD